MKNIILLIFLMAGSFLVEAQEIRYLMRSPRALLMGDAFTALADDEYTLYYNPAGIGKSSLVEMAIINPTLGVTNALDEMDRFEDFPQDAPAIAGRIMGFPVYANLNAAPGVKFGPFAFSMFASSTTSAVLRNAVYPMLDLDYRLDKGFVAGYAYTGGTGGKFEKQNPFARNKKQSTGGVRYSFGISVKHIKREGLSGTFNLLGSDLLNIINSNEDLDLATIRKKLGYAKGKGWGVDVGAEYAWVTGSSELSLAAAISDVGGTNFRKIEGNAEVPEQDMFVSVGAAWRQDFVLFDYSLSVDLKPINEDVGFGRWLHLGAEVGIPLFRFYMGYQEGYVSYGASFRFWIMELTAGFYGVELGSNYQEQQGKRAILYLSLLNFDFDI